MRKIIYFIFALVALVGCNKVQEVDNILFNEKGLIVSLPSDNVSTRVSLTDNESSVSLEWESDDKFTVYTLDSVRVADFIYSTASSDSQTLFTPVGDVQLTDGVDYIAIFPAIDGVTTISEHREALADSLSQQTQTGNNDNGHISDILRMEAEFTYSNSKDTNVRFEYKVATMRIIFETDFVPAKIIFHDGVYSSYILNFSDLTSSDTYTANFVINPNESGDSRDLEFNIYGDDAITYNNFTITSSVVYTAGVQYRASLLSTDLISRIDDMFIYDKADLMEFRDLVNNGCDSLNAVLMNDIDLSGENWTPIGISSSIFYSGVFEGNGKTISNLTVDSENDYQGLFGYMVGGTISNLIIKDANIKGANYVGALCGRVSSGTIENSSVDGGNVMGSEKYIGGMIGCVYTSSSKSSVSLIDCYNTSNVLGSSNVGGLVGYAYLNSSSSSLNFVSCYNNGDITGGAYIGGLLGYTYFWFVSSVSLNFTSCHNNGNITGDSYVGGILGYNKSGAHTSLSDCCNTGNIAGGSYVGGLVGDAFTCSFSVSDCYNEGYVSGSSSVGGIAGHIYEESDSARSISVTNCYNMGDVSGTGGSVGGVVGSSFGITITDCYSLGGISGSSSVGGVVGYSSFSTLTDCYSIGGISGSSSVGGVVGYSYVSTLKYCYNTGNVSGSGDQVGGLAGKTYDSTFMDCYNTGDVLGSSDQVGGIIGYVTYRSSYTNCYNTGNVSGGSYVGGLIGYHYTNYSLSIARYHYITTCYNEGDITGSGDYVGGIVGYGYMFIYITSCYNTGSIVGNNCVGGVLGYGYRYIYITSCYNTDNVSGNSYVGGVLGYDDFQSSLTSCYNTGLISGAFSVGGAIGYYSNSTSISNLYFQSMEGLTDVYATADDNLVSTMTSQGFISTLNAATDEDYWEYDSNNVNNGYPILLSIDY